MKRILYIFILISFLLVPGAYAENQPAHKLLRGATNIITAPLEIPKQARTYQIEGAYKTDHILVWVGCGTVWGNNTGH